MADRTVGARRSEEERGRACKPLLQSRSGGEVHGRKGLRIRPIRGQSCSHQGRLCVRVALNQRQVRHLCEQVVWEPLHQANSDSREGLKGRAGPSGLAFARFSPPARWRDTRKTRRLNGQRRTPKVQPP